jgi:DNA polymerase-3 subunit epsilon
VPKIQNVEYAIVDIETTGGYAAGNGIIEVAIRIFDGRRVIESYETLVNPGMAIPRYIQGLTGIDDEMVRTAPFFEDVAADIFRHLDGRVFVAHNVNFDYSFVKSQLAHAGYTISNRKLCTVRLARQIFPGYPSYSLGNICHSLDISLNNHHRAGGDAEATVTLFARMMEQDTAGFIDKSLKKTSKEQTIPPHVPKEDFLALPSCPGVYYFHDNKGKVVYVGKAKNLKSRVNSHFTNNSDGRQKQNFLRSVFRITFQPMATELMAAILESTEIRRLWPAFNNAQKKPEDVFGIFVYEDQAGYMRLAIEKRRRNTNPIYTFHYKIDGHSVIRKLMREYELCPKLCFLQTSNDGCQGIEDAHCRGACEKKEAPALYNERVQSAIGALTSRPSYLVLDKGMNEDESSCIVVVRGSFFGMGYLPGDLQLMTLDSIKDYLQPYKENSTIRTLLNSYIVHNPGQVFMLEDKEILA